MQLYTCVAVQEWLQGKTLGSTGVNEMLANFQPEDMRLGNPYDDKFVAEWSDPPRFPALYVVPDGPTIVEPEVATHNRDGESVPVAVRYIVKNSNATLSNRQAAYTLLAIDKSMKLFLAESPEGRAARERYGFCIRQRLQSTYGRWNEAVGSSVAIAVFAMDFEVRNNRP
jgi:hypothetical protein